MKLKPWMLVAVAERGSLISDPHRYVGEVVSFPVPANPERPGSVSTIMVRRVPGLPGSAVELPVSAIEGKCDWRGVTVVTYAECLGRGTVPPDMLRYDNAVPVNFKYVPHEWKGVEVEMEAGFDKPIIAVTHERHREPFTLGRWASFVWGVKVLRTEQVS